jgi:hypothetical protein
MLVSSAEKTGEFQRYLEQNSEEDKSTGLFLVYTSQAYNASSMQLTYNSVYYKRIEPCIQCSLQWGTTN